MYKITIPSKLLERHLQKFWEDIHDGVNSRLVKCAKSEADKRCISLLVDYTQNDSNNLLVAPPSILSGFIEKYKDMEGKVSKDIVAGIKFIFNYRKFSRGATGENDWCAARFLQELDVHACCYCNADVVFSKKLRKDKKAIYHSPLDHFYSQKEYPYLALSLYNLVPACDRCNSKFKHDRDVRKEKLLNPFCGSLHELFHFGYAPRKVQEFAQNFAESKVRTFVAPDDCLAKQNLDAFAIEAVYNKLYHFVVQDILNKKYIYEDGYGEWLGGFLKKARNERAVEQFTGLTPGTKQKLKECLCQMSRQDWKQFLFGFSFVPEEINRRPFAKLILDLAGDW